MNKNQKEIWRMPNYYFSSQSDDPLYTHIVSSGDIEYHSHDVYEIVYMTEGALDHNVNGMNMPLSFGDIVFLRPKDSHSFDRNNFEGSHRDIVVEKKFFESTCEFFNGNLLHLYCSPQYPVKLRLTESQLLRFEELLKELVQISPIDKNSRLTFIKFILSEILSLFYRQNYDNYQINDYPPLVNQILQRLNLSLLYKAGLPIILKPFNYDKSYMCRLFKKHIGVTMTQYLNERRLSYVATQLKTTRKSVSQLCQETGFSSISYLNKIFLKKYGMPPLKYRKSK